MGFGLALYVHLAHAARRRGIAVATTDVYRALAPAPARVACLTVQYTADTQALLAGGARPVICHSLESPLIAYKFFHFMPRYAGRFQHNFQFRGTRQRLAGTGTAFHPLYFPTETRARLPLRPWAQREPLVMIIGNTWARRPRPFNFNDWHTRLKVSARFQWWRLLDPGLRAPRLNADRLRAIEYFSPRGGFRLYGHGWDQPTAGLSLAVGRAARQAYGGALAPGALPKRAVLNGYRCAVCFENCVFPGYVTEKIMDCFLAGCVPVYWGAPDITDFVPAETFIDFRRFGTAAELDRYLRDLTEAEAQGYLDAAGDFLASAEFEPFDARRLALEMVDILEAALS